MARIRETLRQPAGVITTSEPLTSPVVEKVPELMPYIEVGASHYFDASPDVLATRLDRTPKKAENAQGVARPHTPLLQVVATPTPPQSTRLAPELVAYHAPDQPASARYGDLVTALLEAARSRTGVVCRTILLTAAKSGIGTTTVLLNLAISAARQGCRVVVVDANLRRPGIADKLGLPPSPGLSEILAGEISLADALQSTLQDNLSAITSGGPAALLADEESVRTFLGTLITDFDLVFIDGPRIEQPLPGTGRSWDTRAVSLLASACQGLYLVVAPTEVDSTSVNELTTGLAARALPLAGCIVAG